VTDEVEPAGGAEPAKGGGADAAGLEGAESAEGGGTAEGDPESEPESDEPRQVRAPWHFKVIAVGSVVYLGYRLYQGISWLAHHL
jgi:hypothetical protein